MAVLRPFPGLGDRVGKLDPGEVFDRVIDHRWAPAGNEIFFQIIVRFRILK